MITDTLHLKYVKGNTLKGNQHTFLGTQGYSAAGPWAH